MKVEEEMGHTPDQDVQDEEKGPGEDRRSGEDRRQLSLQTLSFLMNHLRRLTGIRRSAEREEVLKKRPDSDPDSGSGT